MKPTLCWIAAIRGAAVINHPPGTWRFSTVPSLHFGGATSGPDLPWPRIAMGRASLGQHEAIQIGDATDSTGEPTFLRTTHDHVQRDRVPLPPPEILSGAYRRAARRASPIWVRREGSTRADASRLLVVVRNADPPQKVDACAEKQQRSPQEE